MQCSRHQELLIFAKPTGPALGVRRCLPAPHTDRSAGRSGSLSPVRTGKQRIECHHLIPAASPVRQPWRKLRLKRSLSPTRVYNDFVKSPASGSRSLFLGLSPLQWERERICVET